MDDQSQILVNNLIVNNTAGGISRQHPWNQTQTTKGALDSKNSDIMKLPKVSSNRNLSRSGMPSGHGPATGGPSRAGDEVTIAQITPELAA